MLNLLNNAVMAAQDDDESSCGTCHHLPAQTRNLPYLGGKRLVQFSGTFLFNILLLFRMFDVMGMGLDYSDI